MKAEQKIEKTYILEVSEMEMANLFTVIRKANAGFISMHNDGEGYSVYEEMLKIMQKACK